MTHRPRRAWWFAYAACAAAVLAALAWVTALVLDLERSEEEARARVRATDSVRLALWRMDSFLAPILAREAARPYFEYAAYYPSDRAFTRMLAAIDPSDVLTQSPLLTFRSEYFELHFQVERSGAVTSPQVPVGNHLQLAVATCTTNGTVNADALKLAQVASLLHGVPIFERVGKLERRFVEIAADEKEAARPAPAAQTDQVDEGKSAYADRQRVTKLAKQTAEDFAQNALPAQTGPVYQGPLVAFWQDGRLFFARRVTIGAAVLVQGILANWPRIERALLGVVGDLCPGATLVPVAAERAADDEAGRTLTTVPAALELAAPPAAPSMRWTPSRIVLALTWLAVLAALAAGGVTLRSSIVYGERRSRFASAVTHELRSPLTTFRMYSEMLAEGMVPDETARAEYLQTLRRESTRLAALVENVLAYARLEEGRSRARSERTTLRALLDRAVPPLERRAAEAHAELRVHAPGGESVDLEVDADAVGQILFNLVDNACKYAGSAIELRAETIGGSLRLAIRDFGPGIPPAVERAIFEPFDRGERNETGPVPGVGLGLALARGLARELGGDLTLEHAAGGGACFVLTLPCVRTSLSP